jgi:hypothetical protein
MTGRSWPLIPASWQGRNREHHDAAWRAALTWQERGQYRQPDQSRGGSAEAAGQDGRGRDRRHAGRLEPTHAPGRVFARRERHREHGPYSGDETKSVAVAHLPAAWRAEWRSPRRGPDECRCADNDPASEHASQTARASRRRAASRSTANIPKPTSSCCAATADWPGSRDQTHRETGLGDQRRVRAALQQRRGGSDLCASGRPALRLRATAGQARRCSRSIHPPGAEHTRRYDGSRHERYGYDPPEVVSHGQSRPGADNADKVKCSTPLLRI